MSVMHHKPCDECDDCPYCGEPWPCDAARVRQELAAYLRNAVLDGKLVAAGEDDGILAAADLIDI